MLGGFDQMRREMEKQFEESFKDLEMKAPKNLIREYETPEGGNVREIGKYRLKQISKLLDPVTTTAFLK